jgi:hypothetical protein
MEYQSKVRDMSEPVRLGEILPQVLANIQKRMRENGHSSTRKTAEKQSYRRICL